MTEIHPWNVLSKVPYADHIEKKGNLSYISWASGWSMVKERYPEATFHKHLFDQENGCKLPFMKDDQGNTYVAVSVAIATEEITEVFPVTDFKNKSIKNPSSQDVSNALQRALAKCFAYFGLGLHLYTNEDIPSEDNDSTPSERVIKNAGSEMSISDMHKTFCDNAIEYIETIDNIPDLTHYFNSEIKDRLPLIDEEAKEQGNRLKQSISKRKEYLTKAEDIPFD